MKYPRTFHLPNSLGVTKDDKILDSLEHFYNKEVIYTEKLDGECTSYFNNHIHARSEESTHHPSQAWVKSFLYEKCYKLPKHFQIIGENMYAKHSIQYDLLSSYFYGFAIIDHNKKIFLSWNNTVDIFNELEILTVPILFQGIFNPTFKPPKYSMFTNSEPEGYVVRIKDEFNIHDFKYSVAKYVRANHVNTDKHWKYTWGKNNINKKM